jgi:hypothetical protein
MKAVQNKILSSKGNKLMQISSKNYMKRFKPSYYNLRLYFSNLNRNWLGMHKWDNVHSPEGFDKVNHFPII